MSYRVALANPNLRGRCLVFLPLDIPCLVEISGRPALSGRGMDGWRRDEVKKGQGGEAGGETAVSM